MKGNNKNENYLNHISMIAPKTHCFQKIWHAFIIGGLICCIGQTFRYVYEYTFGLSGDVLSGYVSATMIFLGALLTGLGIYDRIGKFAGAGSIVPITGFANSVVSPAMEFKSEGFIYGLAAKMFIIAGPIVVFGVTSSSLVGVIYYLIYRWF